MPERLFRSCAFCFGSLFYWGHPTRRKLATKQMTHVFQQSSFQSLYFNVQTQFNCNLTHPSNSLHSHSQKQTINQHQITQWVRQSYHHLGLTLLELIRDPFNRPHLSFVYDELTNLHQSPLLFHQNSSKASSNWIRSLPFFKQPQVKVYGGTHLADALEQKKGIIFVSAHLGSWEILAKASYGINRPVWLISKRMSHPWAQWVWNGLRLKTPKRLDHGWRARFIIKALKRGEIVVDVLDQHDPRPQSRSLLFFNQSAWTSTDLARFARLSGAIILPIFTWRSIETHKSIHSVRIGPPCPVLTSDEHTTQFLLHQIEKAILRSPEQWLWIHRRWKEKKKET